MANIDRRTFLRASTAVAAGAIAPDLALATDNNNKELMASPSTTTPEVTKIVARYVVSARYEDLPANVRKEGIRTLLNWVGVAVGGSHHETINIAVDALKPFSGTPQASILGRRERFDGRCYRQSGGSGHRLIRVGCHGRPNTRFADIFPQANHIDWWG